MAPKQNVFGKDNMGAEKETEKGVEDLTSSNEVQRQKPWHKEKAGTVIPAKKRLVKSLMVNHILKLGRVPYSSCPPPPLNGT